MSKVLVLSSGDWGDEFDLEGFAIFEKDAWEHIKDGIPNESFEAYYGSNEFVVFDSKEEYLDHLTEKDISDEEVESLCNLLGIHLLEYSNSLTYGLFVIKSSNY